MARKRKTTGGSLSIFGVGGGIEWENLPTDQELAHSLLVGLADKRVLFNPCAWEMPEHCLMSVLDVRERLTDLLERLPADTALVPDLQVLRAACRAFCDALRPDDSPWLDLPVGRLGPWGAMRDALVPFRQTFGRVLGDLASRYKLTPEPELARLIAEPESTL